MSMLLLVSMCECLFVSIITFVMFFLKKKDFHTHTFTAKNSTQQINEKTQNNNQRQKNRFSQIKSTTENSYVFFVTEILFECMKFLLFSLLLFHCISFFSLFIYKKAWISYFFSFIFIYFLFFLNICGTQQKRYVFMWTVGEKLNERPNNNWYVNHTTAKYKFSW